METMDWTQALECATNGGATTRLIGIIANTVFMTMIEFTLNKVGIKYIDYYFFH